MPKRNIPEDWMPENPPTRPAPEHPAWHLFTREETHDILTRSRELKCTVNSLLLHGLDQTVRREIRRPNAAVPWLIPVNLRGDVRYADDTQNHVSCVDVAVEIGDTPQEIHRRVRRQLGRGEHRANHLLLLLGGILGHRAKVRVIRQSRTRPAGNIGSFSNLGVWNPQGSQFADDGWVFCPPVVSGQLLAAGCVTFNGRLGIATHGIPAMVSPAERMAEWVRRIRQG